MMDLPAALLLAWIKSCALAYGVDPPFALAVAQVESGMRCGPLGRAGTFIGPYGIHRGFRARWDIDHPYVNVVVGVKALRGRDKFKVLRRYNTAFNRAYGQAVMACMKQNRREGRP